MSPFIKDGDEVTISPLFGSSPGFGNVIAFVHPGTGKLIVHRVVRVLGEAYIVKGENALEIDGLIKKENILGVVTRVERKGKRVFFGSGPGRFLIGFLTRKNLLLRVPRPAWRIIRPVMRVFCP